MADGTPVILSLERARRSGPPRLIEQNPQANAYGFAPVADLPRKRFHPADGGAVRLGVARFEPEAVEELLRLFQREAGRTGDWSLHDDLQAARDGAVDPGPEAA